MPTTLVANLLGIRYATLEARRRTGDAAISTSTQIGYFRAERVTYDANGHSTVMPLTGWLSAAAIIKFLNNL